MTGNTFFFGWEVALMEWLQTVFQGFWTKLAVVFTYLGDEKAVVVVLMLIYWCINKDLGRRVAVNLLTGVALNPMIKNIFLRRRPYFDNPSVNCLHPAKSGASADDIAAQGFSFPSGHAMNTMTILGTLAKELRKHVFTIISCILLLLVGISRVILGVHYPTDILTGWVVGLCVVFLMSWLQNVVKKRYILYAAILLFCSCGFFYCNTADFYDAYGIMLGFMAGDMFENSFVNFKNTKTWWRIILRMLMGLGIFFGLSTGLKAIVSAEIQSAFIFRMIRYAVSAFVVIGLYPMSFSLLDRYSRE